jgi:hypothetical protein
MNNFELGQYVMAYDTIVKLHGEESAVAYVERELTEKELERFWKIIEKREAEAQGLANEVKWATISFKALGRD